MSAHDTLVDSWVEEFRVAYEGDARNAARQSFDEYWGWVKAFLVKGGAGQRGWLEQGEAVLQRVTHTATAADLRARVEAVGKLIAAEWAKDSKHRRIHSTLLQGSPNLYDWGRRLQRAAGEDAGDGTAIGRAVDAIEREVDRALRR
jgi:hypothetical protein